MPPSGFASVPDDHTSGYVALIGPPNVGKSTLMNALLGQKLSIVTRKPQTTRQRIIGIHSSDAHQIIFLDTPGIIKPEYELHRAMMGQVEHAVRDADLLLFLHDATKQRPETFSLKQLGGGRAFLVLTKLDLIPQDDALPLVESYAEHREFEEIIPVSARKGFNLDRLMELVVQALPQGPPFYPKDMISEHPERFFVAEIIREKVFQLFHQEIPYSVQVNVVDYEARTDEKDFIDAEIVVNKKSHKGILIGKGGTAIKRLGQTARPDIESFVQSPVYLQLHVKVRENWRDTERMLRSYGYRDA
ncbi:GTPase Era [Salisaeta longa]|uniref:GTPase Era n=1 Tax=Salisaeta longa TaxID=503170 RepID=UPI0003B48593|nr:GTPase Era [Salisaeta longa]